MKLCIDFDDTIHNGQAVMKGHKLGVPHMGAVEVLNRWHSEGHEIVVFTVRGDAPYVADWLNYFGIPFDKVTNIKENADLYIDNRAYKFTTWPAANNLLRVLAPSEVDPKTRGELPAAEAW